jgi:hypothetical protein
MAEIRAENNNNKLLNANRTSLPFVEEINIHEIEKIKVSLHS